MKITFVINSLYGGGAERVLVALANEISKNHKVKIIVFTSRNSFYSLPEEIEILYLSDAGRSLTDRLKQLVLLAKVLRREETDVFISFLSQVNIATVLLRPRSIPIIVSEHNQEAFLKAKFWRFLRKKVYPRADALTVLFPKDAEYYKKFMRHIEVMPNPCAFERSDETFEKENLVIVVARLHHTKNIPMFLRAVSMLDDDLKASYRFCVLGDGDLKESLIREVAELGRQVEFLGAVKNVEEYYRKAKIICLSSDVEGLPMTLIEPLFFETARISTKSSAGVLSLIKDGVDGFLVERGDARAMSEKMEILMRDEELRQRMVQQANKNRQKFDVKNITKQWIELIQDVMEKRTGNKF